MQEEEEGSGGSLPASATAGRGRMEGTTNPLHGGRIDGTPGVLGGAWAGAGAGAGAGGGRPPPPLPVNGGGPAGPPRGGAGWGSPRNTAGGAEGLVFRQPRVEAGLGASCRMEPAVAVPADLRAQPAGAYPAASRAPQRDLDLGLERRLGAPGVGTAPAPESVAEGAFSRAEAAAPSWERAFVDRHVALGASDGITPEAAQMAAVALGPLASEDSARVLDFCRKFLQLRGMGFQRAVVCGALVDAGLDIDAAVGTCLSLGRGP